jgi:hypothetical protein
MTFDTAARWDRYVARDRLRTVISSIMRRRAKKADLSHRKTFCLKGWASKTHTSLGQEATGATVPELPRKRLRSTPELKTYSRAA